MMKNKFPIKSSSFHLPSREKQTNKKYFMNFNCTICNASERIKESSKHCLEPYVTYMSQKGPVVVKGKLDFVEDFFVDGRFALNLLLIQFHVPIIITQKRKDEES